MKTNDSLSTLPLGELKSVNCDKLILMSEDVNGFNLVLGQLKVAKSNYKRAHTSLAHSCWAMLTTITSIATLLLLGASHWNIVLGSLSGLTALIVWLIVAVVKRNHELEIALQRVMLVANELPNKLIQE